MSLLERQGSALPRPTVDSGSDALPSPQDHHHTAPPSYSFSTAAALMSDQSSSANAPGSKGSDGGGGEDHGQSSDMLNSTQMNVPSELDPHTDARAIVRLLQCQQCSLPLRQPMTLPCGNAICRACLPDLHKRENITYPDLPGRGEGFLCPFVECAQEHALGDCSLDVVLAKVLERVSIEAARYRPLTSNTPTKLEERLPSWDKSNGAVESGSRQLQNADGLAPAEPPRSRVLSGGRLLATYTMAEIGELRYSAELSYSLQSPNGEAYGHLDRAFLEHLKEVTRGEMDCTVCYALMLDPLTAPCGHTFCRKCVARVLDHSTGCPACRRTLHIPPGAPASYPSNKRLSALLLTLCPELVAARAEQVERETTALTQGMPEEDREIPLFVCTMAYPGMPTFLHIFEPRYRLMIRRAMESGGRRFGMLLHNERGTPQAELGRVPFMRYGTMLYIEHVQMLPDGRSIIETRGLHRFRVLEHGVLDGYTVGRVQRIDDVPLAVEEAIEAEEIASAQSLTDPASSSSSGNPSNQPPLESLTTLELLRIGTDFVSRMRAAAANWLTTSHAVAYGPMPDDPALFPYWFASVLPLADAHKYRILLKTTVRERLKITAGWVREVEAKWWFSAGSCVIL